MTMLDFRIVPVTPFEQNCSIVWCTASRRAAVVDPGGDVPRIQAALDELGVTVERILITHGHLDHAGGAAALKRALDVPIEGPQREDDFWIAAMEQQSQMFGVGGAERFTPDRWLEDGDEVAVGEQRFAVLHTPGHTPGHVVFHHAGAKLALVGDVLFAGSIGRMDLPGGDSRAMTETLKNVVLPLPDAAAVLPGHGPATTMARERSTNPYLQPSYLR